MSDLRTAAQQALEALEDWDSPVALPAMAAIKAALAEPPVDDPHRDHWVAIAEAAQKIAASTECGLAEAKALCAALDRLTDAAKAEPVQEPVAWTPVDKALPKSGVKVLACYRNRLGNLRRIRAQWIAAKTQEADSDDAEACSEYDEATDTYYTTEGWYECIDNWGDYSSVAVCEGDVTHWMPLPPDPYTAPPQRKPLTEEDDGRNIVGKEYADHSDVFPLYTSPNPEQQKPVRFNCTVVDDAHPNGVPLSQWGKQHEMQPCAGRNCGSTNPNLHSAECFEDYEKATGMNQWRGLTEEEILSLFRTSGSPTAFARAIERAHGIV